MWLITAAHRTPAAAVFVILIKKPGSNWPRHTAVPRRKELVTSLRRWRCAACSSLSNRLLLLVWNWAAFKTLATVKCFNCEAAAEFTVCVSKLNVWYAEMFVEYCVGGCWVRLEFGGDRPVQSQNFWRSKPSVSYWIRTSRRMIICSTLNLGPWCVRLYHRPVTFSGRRWLNGHLSEFCDHHL